MNPPGPATRLSPYVARVLAPNLGPMTLTGTNTWVLGDPAVGPPLVVDPGPDDEGHLAQVREVAGGRAAAVLLTHRHLDHSAGAARLATAVDCEVRAVDPAWRTGALGLDNGSVVESAGVRLEVMATPGHTSDSICLLAVAPESAPELLTGDTVLGFGSTVVTHPDGDLGAYLASLDRLLDLVAERGVSRILPGHGPVVDDPRAVLTGYREHRRARLDQVRAALDDGATTPEEVLVAVYPDTIGTPLEAAATQAVRAQLDHLRPHRGR